MTDPKRWLADANELSCEERRILEAGRLEPTAAQQSANWIALAARLAKAGALASTVSSANTAASAGSTTGAAAGAATSVPPASAAAGAAAGTTAGAGIAAAGAGASLNNASVGLALLKWVTASTLVGASATGGYLLIERTEPASPPERAEQLEEGPSLDEAEPLEETRPLEAPEPAPPQPTQEFDGKALDEPPPPPPLPQAFEAPTTPPKARSEKSTAQPQPSEAFESTKQPNLEEPAKSSRTQGPEPKASDEARRVARARTALRSGDPKSALEELERMSTELRGGTLVQEREALTIEALAALGRQEAAQARGERFLHSFPESPYTARVRAVIER